MNSHLADTGIVVVSLLMAVWVAWCVGSPAGRATTLVCVVLFAIGYRANRWWEARRRDGPRAAAGDAQGSVPREKGYREMETTLPAAPPRREWAVARLFRYKEGERAGQVDSLSVCVALVGAFVLWGLLFAASDAAVPCSHSDVPLVPPADVRCIRSRGVWNAGEIDGKRAEWCSWGLR